MAVVNRLMISLYNNITIMCIDGFGVDRARSIIFQLWIYRIIKKIIRWRERRDGQQKDWPEEASDKEKTLEMIQMII